MTLLNSCLMTSQVFYQIMIILCIVFNGRKRQTTANYIWIMAFGFVAVCANAIFLEVTQMVLRWELCYIASYCALTLLLCKLLFRCTLSEIIFIYFVTQSYVDNSFILAKSLQSFWLQYYFDALTSYYIAYTIVVVSSLPIVFSFLKKKMIPLVETTQKMAFWRYIWAIPVSFYFVYRIGISEKYVHLHTIWEQTGVIVPLLWTVATCLSFLMIVSMPLEVVRHVQYKEKLEALNQLMLMQRDHFHKLSASMEETKQLRHDLKHHMMALAGYAEKEEFTELKEYLKKYMDKSGKEEYISLCSNSAVDSILHHYLDRADRAGIKTSVKSETLKTLPCHESDVCVVLGNLLENALEACFRQTEHERFINVTLSTGNQNMVAIQVTNSGSNDIRRSGDDFLSAKREYASVGMGIASIRKITDKCRGSATFEYSDHRFTAKILLMANSI